MVIGEPAVRVWGLIIIGVAGRGVGVPPGIRGGIMAMDEGGAGAGGFGWGEGGA